MNIHERLELKRTNKVMVWVLLGVIVFCLIQIFK